MSKAIIKPGRPEVRKDGELWCASLDHGTWVEFTHYDTWDLAMEHALWIGLNAGVWSL